MTKKVFWDDPYRTTLDTVVSHVDGDRVRVDATIFFAFSGGQESDAGRWAAIRSSRPTSKASTSSIRCRTIMR